MSKLNGKEDRIVISADTTEILPQQFFGNNNVEVVIVPYGVKSIGEGAFSNCSSLKRIILPESLTYIGPSAFSGCSSLKSIEIPSGVTQLGYDSGSSYLDREGWIFEDCSSLDTISLPVNLETIGCHIFEGCTSLKTIDIPEGVKYIGTAAFERCTSLEKINMPQSVSEIKGSAFENCESLKHISLPGVYSIGNRAFKGCLQLKSIELSNSLEHCSVSEEAFACCKALQTISIPNSYGFFGVFNRNIFKNCNYDLQIFCKALKKVNGLILEGENWRKINSCLSCESITIPKCIESLGQSMYEYTGSFGNYFNRIEDCDSLEEVIVPDNVKEIGLGAFENCKSLKTITILNPNTKISGMAFKECYALEAIYVPKGYRDSFIVQLKHGSLSLLETLVQEISNSRNGCEKENYNDTNKSTEDISQPTMEASNDCGAQFSDSYVIITCAENADPESNWLMLRTEPYTFLKLLPGKNILTVEKYPALRYGFSQIPDCDDLKLQGLGLNLPDASENGLAILEVDLSHFDASEMTTMDYMFDWMQNIRKIKFGGMQTPKLTSADHAFSFTNSDSSIDELDLSGLDFSNLIDASEMFRSAYIGVLNLSGCDFSNVELGMDVMFEDAEIHELILDDILLNEETLERDSIHLYSDIHKLSLKGWKESDIKKVIQDIENYRSEFTIPNMEKTEYVLDSGLDYKLYENDKGEIECTIIKKNEIPLDCFQINGSDLKRFNGNKNDIIVVPDGIETIADNAFENATNVTTVILPETIKKIGHCAFKGCERLRHINIPVSVKEIGYGVFAGCKILRHLYLPDNIERCESLQIEKLNYFRLPIHLWTGGLCETMLVSHLVVGLKGMELPTNIDSSILGENRDSTITFGTFENSSIREDGLSNIDGALLMGKDFEEGEKQTREITALSISDFTLAVPTGVHRLSDGCFGKTRKLPIYIPETVKYISSKAIQTEYALVTTKSNYTHLKNILPQGIDSVTIYMI